MILIIGLFTSTIREVIQSALKLVEGWCNSLEQTANPDKTKLVLFSKKRLQNLSPVFFGKRIPLSDSAKVLGVTVDSKVNFSMHFNNVV